MAIRVTDYTDVTVLINTDLTQAQVEAFILSASLIVDNQLASKGLGTTTLKEIEKYLAAHLITLRDPRALNESADGISFGYEGQTGMGLDSSRYGQTAKQLDTTGSLAALDTPDRAGYIARLKTEIDVEQTTTA